jgi:hypothetical protein
MSQEEKNLNNKILQASGELHAAKQRQAVQEQFAPDYLDIRGIRFFKPLVAHVWLFTRIKFMVLNSMMDLGVCTVYALAHDQEKTRNELMRAVTAGTIVDDAWSFICEKELTSDEVNLILEQLAAELLNLNKPEKKTTMTKTTKAADSNLTGGPQ